MDSRRLFRLHVLLGVVWLVLAGRLLMVAGIQPERYRYRPRGYTERQTLYGHRGQILDQRGRIWVTDREAYKISADQRRVADPEATAAVLARLLRADSAKYEGLLRQRLREKVELLQDPTAHERSLLAPLTQHGWVSIEEEGESEVCQLVAQPRSPEEAAELASRLAPLLGRSQDGLRHQLERIAAAAPIGEIAAKQADEFERLGLPGIEVARNSTRVPARAYLYPRKAGAATVDGNGVARLHPDLDVTLRQLASLRPALEGIDWGTRLLQHRVVLEHQALADAGELVEQVQDSEGEEHRAERLALYGIELEPYLARLAPPGDVGAAWIGQVDRWDRTGVSGWERLFDDSLRPTAGLARDHVRPSGETIPQFPSWVQPARPGNSVRLTLDLTLQEIAEHLIQKEVAAAQADWAGLILVDPQHGAVLAMAGLTTERAARQELGSTCPVTQPFEPGSILKPLVVAAALAEGVVKPTDTFNCPGYLKVGRTRLHCHQHGGHGRLTTAEAVRSSCNVALMQIGQRVGAARLNGWFEKFGLYDKTYVWDPILESRGFVYPDGDKSDPPGWSLTKRATVTYGQGISATMVSISRALCAIANGGTLPNLHVADSILGQDERLVSRFTPHGEERVLPEETARELRDMMLQVVEGKHGTAPRAKSAVYHIAGKTGTATHYRSSQRTVSFVGFAPFDKPRVLALAVLGGTRAGGASGGILCAPMVKQALEQSLAYLGVPPDRDIPPEELMALARDYWQDDARD